MARDYDIVVRGLPGRMPRTFDHIPGGNHRRHQPAPGLWRRLLIASGDLPQILSQATPLNIMPPAEEEFEILQTNENIPRFDWRTLYYTHMSRAWQIDPYLVRRDDTAIHIYPAAYEHISQRMLQLVDDALEEDPNTIIILQGDHGFNYHTTQQFLLHQGHSHEQVMELIHSAFSAVRIPEEFGGLDAPLAPLNISRELVNRFIGPNYDLLP